MPGGIVTVNNMAAEWLTTVFKKKTGTILLITGAAVGVSAYLCYRKQKPCREIKNSNLDLKQPTCSEHEDERIVVLGLDGAGKTSLLSFMSKQEIVQVPQPTTGFNVMCIQNDNKAVNIWEVGGSENIRSYWKNFLQDTNVLVYVVDSADRSRLKEAGSALKNILTEDKLNSVPVIIVANKQDLPDCVKKEDILKTMDIDSRTLENRTVMVLDSQVPPSGNTQGVPEIKAALLSLHG